MRSQVMFDSGVRSAADIFKAIALGAKFVFIGRMWIWGLSIAGKHGRFLQNPQMIIDCLMIDCGLGVRHVLKSLLAEFDILMEEAGFQSIDQINRSAIDSLPNSSNLIAERSGI